MGAIASRVSMAVDGRELKNYLRLSHDDDDALVAMLLTVAVELAEQHVGTNLNHLDQAPPLPPLPLPTLVRLWIFRYVAWRYERRDERSAESVGSGQGSVTWGGTPDYALLAPWRTVRV